MNDGTADSRGTADETALNAAAEVVNQWGRTSQVFTGLWLDQRDGLVGVGIAEGDDIGTQDLLQAQVPAGVRVHVRLVTIEWARLRQVQVHVSYYLGDEGLWGRYAVALGIDRNEKHVEVGLLPTTPDDVAAHIRAQFPTSDLTIDRNASHAIAV